VGLPVSLAVRQPRIDPHETPSIRFAEPVEYCIAAIQLARIFSALSLAMLSIRPLKLHGKLHWLEEIGRQEGSTDASRPRAIGHRPYQVAVHAPGDPHGR
jgi:hypothetical protein